MLSNVTLDDASGSPVSLHETTKRALTTATGLVGIGPLRDSRRVRPQAHGGIDETRYEDGRVIVLEGATFSQVGQEDAYTEFLAITAPMLATLDTGPALLKWTLGATGLQLQRLVRVASDVEPVLTEAAAEIKYQAQFYAEDPRAYSQTLTTATGGALATSGGATMPGTFPVTFDSHAGGTTAVTNAGNRPTPPVFRVYGDCTNAQIVLVGTAKRIALAGRINPGDYLELDAQARTIKLNGTSAALNYLDAANTTWFELPVGASTIQLTAGSNDSVARCDVLYRSAYA